MTRIRGVAEIRRETIAPELMDTEVDYFSIPALDATGGPEPTASKEIDSHKLLLRGGEVLTSRLNPRKSRVHLVPTNLPRQSVASTEFVALRPMLIEPRYLAYLLQGEQTRQELDGLTRSATRSHQRVEPIEVLNLEVPIDQSDEQRRIADFLDDRVARVDQIIAARQRQIGCLRQVQAKWSFDAIRGGGLSERKDSGAPWLGTIPKDWPMLPVASQFQVDLGKMLDEKSQTGTYAVPYLRNTNVQWDVIDTSDLKSTDISPEEMSRFTVQRGDLLICEGGQPGRAAMWDGLESPLGYQKALHRARSRGRSLPEWLLECLRAGVDQEAIVSSSGQTTIAHLPNDQLRATKFPFPDPAVQREQLARLKSLRIKSSEAISAIERQCLAMKEYKQSLITAAVTGKFDVATASTKIPE
ncbi:hypothetical protein JMX53_10940 [Cutibacterium avidum]|uniref:hypothetical protein n=1 Tax=Cutibacterium avidum TaxID=33010 RepID=UPI00192C1DFE|nr:hypothetical protein [Cutibacterium avidum]QQY14750.1 hypothetical protein JMX53_10940 [Cutibacterium avidum]